MISNAVAQWTLEKVAATDETESVSCKVHTGAIISGDQLVVAWKTWIS